MPDFELREECDAPAPEVFKLLWDPTRYPDWWAGTDRVDTERGGVTRYNAQWPDFAYPTRVTPLRPGAVRISCLLSDIEHEWRLEPRATGCAVAVRVTIPDAEAHRADAQRAEVAASLASLVALAERGAG
jgi:uncharacterized protein YndB with AHSA1/START domain